MNWKIYLNVDCKLYKIFRNFKKKTLHAKKNFDSKLNKNFNNFNDAHSRLDSIFQFHVWQIFYNSITNNVNYDNNVDLRHELIDNLLTIFCQINFQWHWDIVQLSTFSKFVNNHKRFFNRDLLNVNFVFKRFRMKFKFQMRREL